MFGKRCGTSGLLAAARRRIRPGRAMPPKASAAPFLSPRRIALGMGNANLTSAKRAKNDEFYTRMPDIENELRHYSEHFKGRTVLCNCDDPYESNFFRYTAPPA